MDEFLSQVKTTLLEGDQLSGTKIHVVIGNEACDLDSTVSAITYAYFLHTKNKEENTITIPVVNIPETHFRLRMETTHFFNKLNIQPRSLLFKDHVDFGRWYTEERLQLTLVDHNVLTGTDVQYEDCVVEVIDHHVRERPVHDSVRVKLDSVGSCCTLVAEELLNDPDFEIDETVAELLYGTILVDTINRSPEAGKITLRDEVALSQLENIIPNVKGDNLFEELQAAKFDISGLLNMEILEKDLKMVNGTAMTIAMCSVTMDMKELLERPNFKTDLDEFCQQQNCEVIVIMTLVTNEDGKPDRQLSVYSQNRIFRDQIADTLDNSEDIDLELEPLEPPFDDITVFSQGNVKASRKKVMPILKSFLHGDITPDVSSKDFVTQHSVPMATEGFSHLEVGDSENVTEDNESRVKFTIESLERSSTEEEIVPIENIEGSYQNFDSVELESLSSVSASHTVHVQQIPHDFDLSISTGQADSTQKTSQNTQNPFGDLPSSTDFNSGLLSSAHSSNIFDLGISDSELVDPFSSVEDSVHPACSFASPKEKEASTSNENETILLESEETDVKGDLSGQSELNASNENKYLSHDNGNPDVTETSVKVEENKTEGNAQSGNPFLAEDTSRLSQVVNFQLNEFDDEAGVADDLINANYNDSNKFSSVNFLDVNSLRMDHPPAKKSASLIVECDAKSQADDLEDLEESELFDKITTPEVGHSGENSPFTLSGVNSPFVNSATGTPFEGLSTYHSRTTSDSGFPDIAVPPNSLMDQGFSESDTDRHLPSFNNAEMVERIQQKKASLGAGLDLLDLEENAGESSTPYTPQNSFREEGGLFMRDNSLPSLMDSDFVEKVQQKRDSLSAKLQSPDGDENGDIEPTTTNPFGDFTDLTSTESVPSTNPFFLANKESLEFDPFGPIDTSTGKDSELVLGDTQTHFKPREETHPNSDILDIFGESDTYKAENQLENQTGSQDWLDFTNSKAQSESYSAQNLNPFLTDIENNVQTGQNILSEQSIAAEIKAVQPVVSSDEIVDQFTMEALNDSANLEAADAVSETLAREIIHDAIESFPDLTNPLVATEMIQRNDADWTEQGSGDSGIGSTGSPQQGPKVQVGTKRLNHDYSVETEYLPSMDPLHGSLNITSTPSDSRSIETDADKEVVEAESFRKVSGDGYTLVPEELHTLDKTAQMEHIPEQAGSIPEKIREMIISENIQSASVSSEPEISNYIDTNTHTIEEDNGILDSDIEAISTENLGISDVTDVRKSTESDNKYSYTEDIDAMNVVDLSGFGKVLGTESETDDTTGYSAELSTVIENVKDGILKDNIQASAVDMNLSNSNNNFVGDFDDQSLEYNNRSDQLDSEGNVISCNPIETKASEEDFNFDNENCRDFEDMTKKSDTNEGKSFEPDFINIFEGLDLKEEKTVVCDIYHKSESKSVEFGDIDTIEDSESITSESESKMSIEQIEIFKDRNDDIMNAVKDDASEFTFESEYDEPDDTSFQDNSAKGIDNEGFEFGSLSDVNIEKDSESMFQEDISDKTGEVELEFRMSKTNEPEPVPEKSSAQVEKSESDNSISSDASSSFPTTSESESELVTVRENIKAMMDEDDIVDESTSDQHDRGPTTVADTGTAAEVLNVVPDENHHLDREKALNLTDFDMKREESETPDIDDSEHVTSEKEESEELKAVDKESKVGIIYETTDTNESINFSRTVIDSEKIQTVGDVGDNLIMINQPMTESYLTVESISSVETPVEEHSSGFYEVNPETKDENITENLYTSPEFETKLSENETGFYEVNKYHDTMTQSAVTIDSLSSVDTPENGEVKGFYEINAELLEQAIENDNENFLKIDEDYSDASVSPLETPETEGMKGFYDINAEKLEKAIERIDSLDVSNSLMVESTYSDSSVSPVETPELEHVSGFYEMNVSMNGSDIVEDRSYEITPLGPEDAPEINVELVGSPNSSNDSFDSETEPSFELNDNKLMEEERKVNEETKAEEKSDVDLCSQSAIGSIDIQPADSVTKIKDRDSEVKEHVDVMTAQSGEFDTAPEINIEMTSSTDTVESHQSAGEGFYEMNAEIQGTMLQNIVIGNAFSPIESPSEEVFSIDYEINPMVPDVKDNSSTESFEENSPETQCKPFVRFFVNDKENNDKVDEMADALVVTALSEAIESLQEQNSNENFGRNEEEKTDNMIDFDKSEESDKYFKMADDLVNEAISNAIEVVQEIRLNEEEPFIKSEIASAMKEISDSSDSDASSTTTEGSYRIVDSVDLSPDVTPDREEVFSSDLVSDKDNVIVEEIFEEKDLVTREDFEDKVDKEDAEKQMFTNEVEKKTYNFETEIVPTDVVSADSHFLNDENGNITIERSEPDLNLSLETGKTDREHETDCSILKEQEDVKEVDDKTKKFERQETLIPDIIISTEETPPGSDESESDVNKEVVKSDEVDLVTEVTESVIEKEEAIDNMSNIKLGTEITDSYEIKEHEIDGQEVVNSKAEGDKNKDRPDKIDVVEENLIAINKNKSETLNESEGEDFKAELSYLIDGSEMSILNKNQEFKQQRKVIEEVIINAETAVLESEVNSVHTAKEPLSEIVSFDQIMEGNEPEVLLENIADYNKAESVPVTEDGNVNAEQISEIDDKKSVTLNGTEKKEEVPYHNIKDLEGEKDEKKGSKAKKGQAEYVTRKEIFYTSAGRMSISIDSVVDPPSDSDQVYTGGQDIIHEEAHEAIQVSHILARTGSAIYHADEVLTQLSEATLAQQHDIAQAATFVVSDSDDDDDTLSNYSQPVDDDDDVASEKHVVIEKVEPEKPKASHEKMKMDDTQEWHEDPIPGMGATTQDSSTDESDTESDSEYTKPARPDSLLNGARRKKKIAANNFLSPDSTDDLVEGVDDIPTPDDLETPSDIEGELEWEDDTPITPTSDSKKFVEYRDDEAEREKYENTKFRKVEIAGKDYRVDMKVIEPYKKVLSHGGYYGDGLNAIILFCGCYLPDRGRRDYQYVMDNLFLYVISTLELLVAEDYMIVYFHGATPRRQMPSFGWLKRCYQMIDRRLRKNLKALLMVHPTLWLKTVVMMTKPFISSKFSSKLRFVKTLQELGKIVPMEYIYVPEPVSHTERMLQTDPEYLEKWEKEQEKKGLVETKKSKFSFLKRRK
ncbi:uncharacterized protein LOC123542835 isoform X2 [Mercenaria mercenaria]|uniref:uncharacterized protein LOC123542835 isoform X2 n=1 Tax=Mercenaria mercenaria TaxID=6596 RepID=UPI00234E9FF3|nr:uncharacterized protein LOC123542835 isoform X2 [Mercenaria mercenaria]